MVSLIDGFRDLRYEKLSCDTIKYGISGNKISFVVKGSVHHFIGELYPLLNTNLYANSKIMLLLFRIRAKQK